MIEFLNKLLSRVNLKLVSVKPTKAKTSFTKEELEALYKIEELEEYYNCSKDPIYFINTYVKCNIFSGTTDLKLLPYQENMVNLFQDNKFSLVNSTRQSGKSLIPILYLLHQLVFTDNADIGIMSHNTNTSRYCLQLIRDCYNNLPNFLKQKVETSTRDEFSLSNGSKIKVATKSKVVLLLYFTHIFLDEFAFVEKASEIMDILLPVIIACNNKKLIITSTKRKNSYFNELVENPREFKVLNVNWDEIPNRDEEWKMNMISMMGEQAFEEQFVV